MIGPFALVVLDMAGTTVRDDGAVDAAFRQALLAVDIGSGTARFDETARYVHQTMGQSKADVFAALLDPEDAATATRAFARAYEDIVAAGDVLAMEGAGDLFGSLRAAKVKVCLTTGFAPTTRNALLTALGWTDLVDLALSPADVGRGRPEPDLIFGAMDRLGVAASSAVAVVGDTTSDLEAGSRAHAGAVIGVLSGAHDRTTLETAPHTHIIDDLSQLLEVLRNPS